MNGANTLLLGVLSLTDAIWRPMRAADWSQPTPAVIHELRSSFEASGVPWRVSGSGAARSRGERALQDLADEGMVVLHGRDKRRGVKLSESGEHVARALAGLPSVAESWHFLGDVLALEQTDDRLGRLASELWLSGLPNYGCDPDQEAKLGEVQCLAASAIRRGWIEARSDCHGRAWYTVTPLGREVISGPEPTMPTDLPEPIDGAFLAYLRAVAEWRQRIRGMKPNTPGEIGRCPLPTSINLKRPSRD